VVVARTVTTVVFLIKKRNQKVCTGVSASLLKEVHLLEKVATRDKARVFYYDIETKSQTALI
jgi:hypothetical protein